MGLRDAFSIAAAGLNAQRTRMEAVSSNLANRSTTSTREGGPYRRLLPVFAAEPFSADADPAQQALRTVRVDRIVESTDDPLLRFDPDHPHADANGFVAYPDIDPVHEMVDMVSAVRSYEANVTVVKSVRNMMRSALEIIG